MVHLEVKGGMVQIRMRNVPPYELEAELMNGITEMLAEFNQGYDDISSEMEQTRR